MCEFGEYCYVFFHHNEDLFCLLFSIGTFLVPLKAFEVVLQWK